MGDFNQPLADAAAAWVQGSDPDEAAVVLTDTAFDLLSKDVAALRPQLQEALTGWAVARAEQVSDHAAAAVLAKQVGDPVDPATAEMLVAGVVAKAGAADYSSWERAQDVKSQWRDPQGRWRTMNRRIQVDQDRKLSGSRAKELGIPKPVGNLSAEQKQSYRQSYLQVLNTLNDANSVGAVGGVTYLWRDRDGNVEERFTARHRGDDGKPLVQVPSDYFSDAAGQELVGLQVHVDPDLSLGGAAVDVLGALGVDPNRGIPAVNRGVQVGQFAGDVSQALTQGGKKDPGRPRQQDYKRLESTAGVLRDTLGPALPSSANLAIGAAQMAGRHGQDFEDTFGPHIQRASYRQRGTEKAPPQELQNKLSGMLDTPNGKSSLARHLFVIGNPNGDDPVNGIRTKMGGRLADYSPVRDHLRSVLPDKSRVDLHREAGRHTPSQGIVIDGKGRIVTESVGYGEDWYLPFTGKRLRQLKDGEYARTRVWGGPTTEDLRVALTSNARAFTVVSHHGTYTVEFADDFRGTRRFNDKAARMVDTYRRLLDAVRSQKATKGTGEIPESRLQELREMAYQQAKQMGDVSQEDALFRSMTQQERSHPELDPDTRDQIDRMLVDTFNGRNKGAHLTDRKSAVDLAVQRRVREEAARYGVDPRQLNVDVIESAAQQEYLATPQKLWDELGLGRQYSQMRRQRLSERQTAGSTYQLDGDGYAAALEALQEQFPYYLKPIVYRRWDESGRGVTDEGGYVRPGDARPVKTKIGYHDAPNSKIGSGKRSAASMFGRDGGDTTVEGARQPAAAAAPAAGFPKRPADPKEQFNGKVGRLREAVKVIQQAVGPENQAKAVEQLGGAQKVRMVMEQTPGMLPKEQQQAYFDAVEQVATRAAAIGERHVPMPADLLRDVKDLQRIAPVQATRTIRGDGAERWGAGDVQRLQVLARLGEDADLVTSAQIDALTRGVEFEGEAYQPGAPAAVRAAEWARLAGEAQRLGAQLPPDPATDVDLDGAIRKVLKFAASSFKAGAQDSPEGQSEVDAKRTRAVDLTRVLLQARQLKSTKPEEAAAPSVLKEPEPETPKEPSEPKALENRTDPLTATEALRANPREFVYRDREGNASVQRGGVAQFEMMAEQEPPQPEPQPEPPRERQPGRDRLRRHNQPDTGEKAPPPPPTPADVAAKKKRRLLNDAVDLLGLGQGEDPIPWMDLTPEEHNLLSQARRADLGMKRLIDRAYPDRFIEPGHPELAKRLRVTRMVRA